MRISDWSSDVCSSDLPLVIRKGKKVLACQTHICGSDKLAPDRNKITQGECSQSQIGRASCRESVSVRVDLGGRRSIKKKTDLSQETGSKSHLTETTTDRNQRAIRKIEQIICCN